MAEKLGLGSTVRELKIGQSFTNPKSTAFHTVKYDFKPASVDNSKTTTLNVGNNNQVTITHLDGAGIPQTVFKGSQRPYQKECVLIIDRITGEITLEKLECNVQVKKTRTEYNKVHPPQDKLNQGNDRSGNALSSISSRSLTPPMVGHRVSNKTRVASGCRRPDRPITHLVPKHSPLHPSPSYPSPGHHIRSPKRELHNNVNNESHNQSTLASLPMIGIDDFSDPGPSPHNMLVHHTSHSSHNTTNEKSPTIPISDTENGVGEMSDTSSSSSDSDSDSDVENTTITNKNTNKSNGYSHNNSIATETDTHLLNEDLCLSESGSDSE